MQLNFIGRAARAVALVGALTSTVLLAAPSVASAITPAGNGAQEHLRLSINSGAPGTIIIRGRYVDGGTTYDHGQRTLAVFADGSFTISHPGGNFTFSLNPQSCVFHVIGTGNYTIRNGYGAYRGVTGEGTYSLHGYGVFGRRANGRCDTHSNPISETDIVRASGSMS